MLDKNTSLVWEYLKNHFANSNKSVYLPDIMPIGLPVEDIIKSLDILEDNGYININHKYPSKPIESINI